MRKGEFGTDYVSSGNGEVCRHHWLVEPPSGRVSRAVCSRCGSTTEFLNYWSAGSGIREFDLGRDSRCLAEAIDGNKVRVSPELALDAPGSQSGERANGQ